MEWQSEVGIESRTCRLNRPMIYSYSIVRLQSTSVQLHTAEDSVPLVDHILEVQSVWLTRKKCAVSAEKNSFCFFYNRDWDTSLAFVVMVTTSLFTNSQSLLAFCYFILLICKMLVNYEGNWHTCSNSFIMCNLVSAISDCKFVKLT